MYTFLYSGRIVEGEFPERVYLNSMDLSLAKNICDDLKNKEVVIEMFITKDERDIVDLLDSPDVNMEEQPYLQYYCLSRVLITKENIINFLQPANNFIGNFLNLAIHEGLGE